MELLSSDDESCIASPSCAGEPSRLPNWDLAADESERALSAESGRDEPSAERGREPHADIGLEPSEIVEIVEVVRGSTPDGGAEPAVEPGRLAAEEEALADHPGARRGCEVEGRPARPRPPPAEVSMRRPSTATS